MADKKLIAAAMVAALAGGGVAGAALGTPVLSVAQEGDDTTTTVEPGDDTEGDRPGFEFGRGHGPFGVVIDLEAAAEALGISEDDLRAALEDGQTIAEVAEAQGVDVQEVIDAMVAAANENIDEAVAELRDELPDRITDLVNEGFPEGRGPGGGHRIGFGFFATLDAAAETIGITEDDLRDALRDGETIAEVAEAQGVEPQTVIDALVADATTRIDDAIADGELDADQAAELKEDLPERMANLVNGEGGPHWPGGAGPGD